MSTPVLTKISCSLLGAAIAMGIAVSVHLSSPSWLQVHALSIMPTATIDLPVLPTQTPVPAHPTQTSNPVIPALVMQTPVTTQPIVPTAVAPEPPATLTVPLPTSVPLPASVPVAPSVPAAPGTGPTYTDQANAFSISYPSTWVPVQVNTGFATRSTDQDAAVFINVTPSASMDSTTLQTRLQTDLATFLQQVNGTAQGSPQVQTVQVGGVEAEVLAVPFVHNGVSCAITVSGAYRLGRFYEMTGFLFNINGSMAQQDLSELQAVLNSFQFL